MIIAALMIAFAQDAQRCENPIGWEADHQREICGPKVVPVTAQNVASFKQKWRPAAVRIGRLMFEASCQRTSWDFANRSDSTVQAQLSRDPKYARFSAAQRDDVRVWYNRTVQQTAKALGKC